MNAETKCPKCNRTVPKAWMTRVHVLPRFLGRENPRDVWRSSVILVCRECAQQEEIHQEADYKALAVSNNRDPYESFLEVMYEVDALVSLPLPHKKLADSMARMLFTTIITAMETYLSDTFINRVLGDNQSLRRCVETNPELRDRKLNLGDIFKRQEDLREEVRSYLIDVLFHNLAKVRLMYQSVLNVEFPDDLGDIFRAIEKRHDIVHRGGKSKSGTLTTVYPTEVQLLVRSIKKFVRTIEDHLLSER